MTLGKVVGTIVSDQKIDDYKSLKILIVQPVDPQGQPLGSSVIALDVVQAGEGDTVLVLDEGNSSRMILGDSMAPVRTVVAGIVDVVATESKEKDDESG